jgi:predicted membrane protein
LLVFVLAYLVITSSFYALALLIVRLVRFLGWKRVLPAKTLYYLVSVIALGPVFVLALNTLSQLEIKDVILVMILLLVGCFYVLRRSRKEVL